eukprot:5496748-Prymnesium_polylepis.1
MQDLFRRCAEPPGTQGEAVVAKSRVDRMLAQEVLMKWTVRCLLTATVSNLVMGAGWLASIALGGDYDLVWAMHLIYLLCAAIAQTIIGSCLISFALIANKTKAKAVAPASDEGARSSVDPGHRVM